MEISAGSPMVAVGSLSGEGTAKVTVVPPRISWQQPGECIHAAVVNANARRTTAGARKPSRSITTAGYSQGAQRLLKSSTSVKWRTHSLAEEPFDAAVPLVDPVDTCRNRSS